MFQNIKTIHGKMLERLLKTVEGIFLAALQLEGALCLMCVNVTATASLT